MTKPNTPAQHKPPAGAMVPTPQRELATELNSPNVIKAVGDALGQNPKLSAEFFLRVAITSCMGKPELAEAMKVPAGKASLLNALMRCAQAGLQPDGRMAHLIPFWSTKSQCYLVNVIFDYKGLLTLAKRNGVDAKAILVCSRDKFQMMEDDGSGVTKVIHEYDPFGERGDLIGVYSRAVEKDKAPDYEFMSMKEVESSRNRSRAKDDGPWITDFGEMTKKTVVRRHSKRWDLDAQTREALNNDDDTPPALSPGAPAPLLSAPLFSAPAKPALAAQEPSENINPEPQPVISSQEPPEPAPEPTKKAPQPPAEPPGSASLVKVLREKFAGERIGEGALFEFLHGIGSCDHAINTLEELALANPPVVLMLSQQFDDIAARIKGNQ